jgi:hypothetical protein
MKRADIAAKRSFRGLVDHDHCSSGSLIKFAEAGERCVGVAL